MMELSRWMKHFNRGAARALAALAVILIVNGIISYQTSQPFGVVEFIFNGGLPIICVALGVIASVAGANWLAIAAERGKLK